MISRLHRLSKAHFEGFVAQRRVHGTLFSLAYSPEGAAARAAVVVSKKVAAKATERNLLRRRAREALRHMQPPKGTYVLTAKKTAARASFDAVRTEIERLTRSLQ